MLHSASDLPIGDVLVSRVGDIIGLLIGRDVETSEFVFNKSKLGAPIGDTL